MDELHTKLFLASSQRGWNLALKDTEGIQAARTDSYLVEAVCPDQEVSEELTRFLVANQIIHLVKVSIQSTVLGDPLEGGIRATGSDERGIGTE